MKELVVYGVSSGIVKLITSINTKKNTWKFEGFLDDGKKGKDASFMGLPILGGKEMIKHYCERQCYFINNVWSKTESRIRIAKRLNKYQVKYATLISPDVDVNFVNIGFDCIIMDGVTIGANTRIGNHVGIRLNSSINHDCIVEDFASIGPGAIICGYVIIKERAFIGAGSVIKTRVTINARSTVGLGAIVHNDVKEGDIVAAAPARSIKKLIPADE
jgi:sugar O-acyltransferase (sialic acid O-acetyltransferase NeuD family)